MNNLQASNLSLSFNNKKVLDDINLSVVPGDILLVSGKNGCGKTTLMKTLAGIYKPQSGSVIICGLDYYDKKIYQHVGYAPWRFGTYDSIKVFEYLSFFAAGGGLTGLNARRKINTLLEMFGMKELANEQVRLLSAGTLQRLSIIRSIIHDPEVLLFDEPLNCLDPQGRALFASIVKDRAKHGASVIISSHNLTQMEDVCNTVCFIRDGRIALKDSLDNILTDDRRHSMVKIILADISQSQKVIGLIRPLDDVLSLSIDGTTLLVNLRDEEGVFEELLNILLQNNIATLTFAREKHTLEEIFIRNFEV